MKIAKEVEELLNDAVLNAGRRGNEYVTPEHVWFVLADRPAFQAAFKSCGGDVKKLKSRLEDYLGQMDTVEKDEGGIEVSYGLSQTIEEAARKAISSDRDTIGLPHLLYSMMGWRRATARILFRCRAWNAWTFWWNWAPMVPGERWGLERAEQAEPTVMQEQAEPLIWIMRKMQKRSGRAFCFNTRSVSMMR